jgi:biopolymer transport protein ExbB/TolQ
VKALTDILYMISSALLAPAIVALLALLVWTLVLSGGFLKELLERRRVRGNLSAAVSAARQYRSQVMPVWEILASAKSGLPRRFVDFVGQDIADGEVLQQALATIENDVATSVARLSFITRVSPMLGLMGTLIPLGPALAGLANGNMQVMAGNLIVAFTATVVGLLVSSIAYGIGVARRTWYTRDVTDLEFVCRQVTVEERSRVAEA